MHESSELARPRLLANTNPPDEVVRLLQALRTRDSAAWTKLFEEHRDLVFRAAFTQVGDRELAEDITAQVFLEAIEGIGRYRDRGKPLGAWLVTIARHRSLDAIRKRRREERSPALERSENVHSWTPAIESLQSLTPEQREVIHLRFVEDLSIETVASMTGRSPGAVKSLQHRALRQLRSQLTRAEGDKPDA
jgi:RNA polymerase sigma-70 factor (ECF subfamily)